MYAYSARALTNAGDINASQVVIGEFIGKLRDRVPSYEEFEAGILELRFSEESTKQRGVVHYLLSRFDRHLRKESVVDYDAMTIEHVASQNAQAGTTQLLPEIVGELGNLILIPEKLNTELANKPFLKKREILKKADVPLDDILKKATKWTDKEIRERTKLLASLGQSKVFKV